MNHISVRIIQFYDFSTHFLWISLKLIPANRCDTVHLPDIVIVFFDVLVCHLIRFCQLEAHSALCICITRLIIFACLIQCIHPEVSCFFKRIFLFCQRFGCFSCVLVFNETLNSIQHITQEIHNFLCDRFILTGNFLNKFLVVPEFPRSIRSDLLHDLVPGKFLTMFFISSFIALNHLFKCLVFRC